MSKVFNYGAAPISSDGGAGAGAGGGGVKRAGAGDDDGIITASATKIFVSQFLGGRNGQFFTLLAVPEQQFRLLKDLCAKLVEKLPFVIVEKNGYIEDGELLKLYLFLSSPLQKAIAASLDVSPGALLRSVAECVRGDPLH